MSTLFSLHVCGSSHCDVPLCHTVRNTLSLTQDAYQSWSPKSSWIKYTRDSFILASRTKHHSSKKSKQPNALFVEDIQRQIGHCMASSTQASWKIMMLTYLITVKSGLVFPRRLGQCSVSAMCVRQSKPDDHAEKEFKVLASPTTCCSPESLNPGSSLCQ